MPCYLCQAEIPELSECDGCQEVSGCDDCMEIREVSMGERKGEIYVVKVLCKICSKP